MSTMNRKPDQAAGLRRMLARPGMRVLPLVSVLSGEAQARLAMHLGAAHAHLGRRVVIVDGSQGCMASVMNLEPRHELLDLLQGEKEFGEVAVDGPDALRLVPAARGLASMEHADDGGWAEFLGAFAGLSESPDLVLLNCAPGEPHAACRAAGATAGTAAAGANEVVLALDASNDSVTAAYALIKAALRADGQRRYRLVFAETAAGEPVAGLQRRMIDAAQRFLGAELRAGGVLPRHEALQSGFGSATRQTIVTSDPAHPAAAAFHSLAGASAEWALPEFSRPAAAAAAMHQA